MESTLTTYIALFHHKDHAEAALQDLEGAGFSQSAVTVIGGGNGAGYSEAAGVYGSGYGTGSQSSLADVGVPEADQKHLQDGLDAGGTVLVLEGAGDRAEAIEKIFHAHSTKKIDETDVTRREAYVAPVVAAPVAAPVAAETAVIPVVEEELAVGKREVDRGGVRVYRRVVEEPVSADVTLREEHVVVDRRPVDRAVTESDLRGGNRTIELTETAEEAVVGKTSRVVEEVRLGKEASEHVETIHDTVRHTEVDVEPVEGRTAGGLGTGVGTTTTRKTDY